MFSLGFLRGRRRGFGLLEVLVSVGIFGFLSGILFLLFGKGTAAIRMASSRQQAQLSLNKAHFWLKRDLEQADPARIRRKRISIPGGGDAVWFLTAMDPAESDPDRQYKRHPETGRPRFQANVLYYLVRPTDYSRVSGGLVAGVDTDPDGDFFAPHKFLVRKLIDRTPNPDDTESLLTSTEVDAFITSPIDYTLAPFDSEPDVAEHRLVADKLLSFQVLLDQSVVEVKTSAVRLDEARRAVALGSVSLRNNPLTSHREARFYLRH